jgi:hypothetical protein
MMACVYAHRVWPARKRVVARHICRHTETAFGWLWEQLRRRPSQTTFSGRYEHIKLRLARNQLGKCKVPLGRAGWPARFLQRSIHPAI